MPPRRDSRMRRIEEVYGEDNSHPNQPNPEISEAVQQALNSMMPGLISQVVEAVRQAGGTTTHNNVGGTGPTSTGTTTATVGTQLTLHQWLEKFHKQKPKSFSSTTNPIEAEHWIKHLEKIFEILECPDNIQVRLAAYKLEGDANQWWQSWKQVRGGNTVVENLMWSQFRDAFLQQYFTEADRESYIRDYSALKQHEDESVSDFVARFLRLVSFAGPLAGTEAHQIQKFRWALQNHYRSKMMGQRFTELSHIINMARDIELEHIDSLATKGDSKKRSHNSSFGSQSGQTTIRPKYNFAGQRKRGSSRSFQSSGAASKTGNLAPPAQCKDCGKIHRPGPCLRMTGACYSCGQQGHMARDCKQSQSGGSRSKD